MTVVYPRKFRQQMSAQAVLRHVVLDREIHMVTLNRYRFNEQRSCKDLTDLVEKLNGQPRDLVRDLSHHIADEARHAYWLTDLLDDLGEPIGTPPGTSYIDEFERLLDHNIPAEDQVIESLAAINVTEKRGCEYFSAHIKALKEAEQTPENIRIRETIEQILPEEAGHVRWGTRRLAEIGKRSPEHHAKVEQARRKYAAIEQAAFESSMDFLAGAEFRRVNNLMEVAKTLPLWQQPQYLVERLPQSLLSSDLQKTRIEAAQRAWNRDPQGFVQKFIPLFLGGLNDNLPKGEPKEKQSTGVS